VDGFRGLLLHRQLPGKLFKKCRIRIHRPLDLRDFYSRPYEKEAGSAVVDELTGLLKDPD
jgi:hypothetical protein